jgi:hypothetical protein
MFVKLLLLIIILMEYLKPWDDEKLDIWTNSKNPLRDLSSPPLSKPIPYVCYIREEAEKGGNLQLEEELKKIKIPSDITSKYKTGNYGEYLYPNGKVQEIPKDAFDIRGC